jgi:photosystem II stability/assembly factor-like uncharacterized protein
MKHIVTFILSFVLLSQVSQAQNTQTNPDTNGNPPATQSLGWVKIPIGSTKGVGSLSFPSKDTAFCLSDPSLRSTDGGNTWQPFTLPVNYFYQFVDGQNGYAAGYSSGLAYHTSDGGQHWISSNDSNVLVDIVLAVTRDTAFIFGDDITRTTNGGKSWALPLKTVYDDHISGAAFFDSKHGIGVGYLQPGPPPHNEQSAGCFTTSNGGETWEQQYSGAGHALIGVTFVSSDTIIAIGGLNYVSRSTNGGVKWDSIVSPLLDNAHGIAAIDNKAGRLIAVGSPGLILSSLDAGLTWQKEVSGVTSDLVSIKMLDRNVALASGDSGVILKTTNGGTDWVQVAPPSSQSLSVLSFQDPETPNVEIVYDLPQLQNVKAIVYNLMGKQIATLANGELQQPGKQRLIFNGNAVPSGTYLYTITTNRFHTSGKFEITH